MDGLKVGNEALKKVNDMLNVEDVEKILDETREAIDKQKVSLLFLCWYTITEIPMLRFNTKTKEYMYIKLNSYGENYNFVWSFRHSWSQFWLLTFTA